VGELVITLSSAQSALKEDMVVKIAILAEKYSPGNFSPFSSCTSYNAPLAVIGVLLCLSVSVYWLCGLPLRNLLPLPRILTTALHHIIYSSPFLSNSASCTPSHSLPYPPIAITGNKWYVDTMVSVMLVAGDFVAEPVWHRVIMIVTNNLGKMS
jgi:hypothetical protein